MEVRAVVDKVVRRRRWAVDVRGAVVVERTERASERVRG